MVIALTVFGFIFVCVAIMTIVVIKYYENKLPDKSIEEIDEKIKKCNEALEIEKDVMKVEEILDIKEYWEQEKAKLVKHGINK